MADEQSSKDFAFCVLCRKNHDQGRKHIYSKKHKKALENVLLKFGKKVDEVRKYLHNPSVQDGELEPGAKFWCHFCGEDVNKHVTDRRVSITYGGVFEHFASKNHHKKLHSFWREHGAEKEKKSAFLVTNEQYIRFKEGVDKALKEHEEVMEKKREKEAEKIKQIEVKQKRESQQPPEIRPQQPLVIYKTVQNEFGIQQNPTGWHEGFRVWGGGIFKYRQGSDQWYPWEMDKEEGVPGNTSNAGVGLSSPRGIQTAKAFGSNLTCIDIKGLGQGEGNIYSGATPPWLRDDDDDNDDKKETCIGPSLEDFQKHVQRKKKSAQNPNRVGANFEREKQTDEEWLPSFGRVWNQGPRWQSRHEFRNEHRKKKN
ncbi:coiled-coil domain-containing protein 84-like [Actinia tenebrosa]|uniref:Coiled-coil domain-containing protein 84-like n=1 Tax=Actinia tenebrosa TaxID=6105 RepID=A0A6P8HUL1_ACTTE|nr:coiled-coil domain-containing protein 84-like [Actinia tenebrosa]